MNKNISKSKIRKFKIEASRRALRKARSAAISISRNRLAKERRADKLKTIWVTLDDSYNGGNCHGGTISFSRHLLRFLGYGRKAKVGAVRADTILELRDNIYTRRAIFAAYQAGIRRKREKSSLDKDHSDKTE